MSSEYLCLFSAQTINPNSIKTKAIMYVPQHGFMLLSTDCIRIGLPEQSAEQNTQLLDIHPTIGKHPYSRLSNG